MSKTHNFGKKNLFNIILECHFLNTRNNPSPLSVAAQCFNQLIIEKWKSAILNSSEQHGSHSSTCSEPLHLDTAISVISEKNQPKMSGSARPVEEVGNQPDAVVRQMKNLEVSDSPSLTDEEKKVR